MKKAIFMTVLICVTFRVFGQDYNTHRLETVSRIWGETYLFHPSITRADRNIQWERQLVEFLPLVKGDITPDEFREALNSKLISVLDDPFTAVQDKTPQYPVYSGILTDGFADLIRLDGKQLTSLDALKQIYDKIADSTTDKPLIVDLRITENLQLAPQSYNFFEYFASMFIDEPLMLSAQVTREHFGWDEYNDWWFYEQRWKVSPPNKQMENSSKLMPFTHYLPTLAQYNPDLDSGEYPYIARPVYFVANDSFLSYYGTLLNDLRTARKGICVFRDESGPIIGDANGMIHKYGFEEFDFYLNTAFAIREGKAGVSYNFSTRGITIDHIRKFAAAKSVMAEPPMPFPFSIEPARYENANAELSLEEKILGIIKIWTVVNYFHENKGDKDHDLYWEKALGEYLALVQHTASDREYFELVQRMMSPLNDSHVSTFHPSIVDYSQFFAAPLEFDWIEEQMIVTEVRERAGDAVKAGDRIVSVDGKPVLEIMDEAARKYSYSNRQGLLASVINAGYFTGAPGSIMTLGVEDSDKKIRVLELPRSLHIYELMGGGKQKPSTQLYTGNIGYIDMAAFMDSSTLESALEEMLGTAGLILDFRDSYPTADFGRFLSILCPNMTPVRISTVPIVSAGSRTEQTTVSNCVPDPAVRYKSPVVVLIDKSMISRPEDICIALSAFPGVTFVGDQTQGTDGEMAVIYLPGGTTSFTGQRVAFGDGSKFRGVGIMPDIPVRRTVKAVRDGRDELLDKALEVLRKIE